MDLKGDLVIGRIKKLSPEIMQRKMILIGQMVAFTRQLDMRMNSDQQIVKYIKEFEKLAKTDTYPEGLRREIL